MLTKFYGATDFVDKISFLILKQGTLFVGWYSYAYTLQWYRCKQSARENTEVQ